MRVMLTALAATVGGVLAFGLATFLMRPFPRYYAVAYREFASPTADQGFRGLGDGVRSPQSFYWHEVTSSKRLDLEVLKELGRAPDYPVVLPALYADKFLEAEERRSRDGLFLILHYDYIDEWEQVKMLEAEALAEFGGFERAFVRLVAERGASVSPVTEAKFFYRDRWLHPEEHLTRAVPIFAGALGGGFVVAAVLGRREKRDRLT